MRTGHEQARPFRKLAARVAPHISDSIALFLAYFSITLVAFTAMAACSFL